MLLFVVQKIIINILLVCLSIFKTLSQTNEITIKCMQDIALSRIGSPYVANTLDKFDNEVLTFHSDQFDCVSYVEYVIAQAMFHSSPLQKSFEQNLTDLRYRDGVISGYGSRLHYFSEWLIQAEANGIISIISTPTNINLFKKINYMSIHRHLYKKANEKDWMAIKNSEKYITKNNLSYIPKGKVKSVYSELREMDIIAITSTKGGLDISHTGFIHFQNGFPHLLHASENGKKVLVSSKPLGDYLLSNKKYSGIIIGRIK
jgi:Protein of unknown function (DUF1460)